MCGRVSRLALCISVFVWAGLCTWSTPSARADDSDSDMDMVTALEPVPTAHPHTKRRRGTKFRAKRTVKAYQARQRTWPDDSGNDFALHQGHAFPPLVIHVAGAPSPFVLDVESDVGGFSDAAQAAAREAFGAWQGGPSVHPRLLDLIYLATRHFNAPSCHLISGLRRDRKASRHSHGMAADIVLPGVSDKLLAAFFREQGFTGVGTYPRSGFVHIDVRETSYFWVDRSPPGRRRNKVIQVRHDESHRADLEALARGVAPEADPADLEDALAKRLVRKRPTRRARRH